MNKTLFYPLCSLLLGCLTTLTPSVFANSNSTLTIGFGSCAHQMAEQPIWDVIAKHQPELFILGGDNVYVDSSETEKFTEAYARLSANPYFSSFRKTTTLIGTWDDHDYGLGDGGKNFTAKEASKAAFITFFDYPELNQLKNKDRGIYHTRWLEHKGKSIQVILLDTRWYRDPLFKTYLSRKQRDALNLGPFQPNLDTSTTLLGAEQWTWLEKELKKTADLKILVSSIQFLNEYSGFEVWANFPHERLKLLEMLYQNTDSSLMILSGDIHKAEITEIKYKDRRFTEVTSSGLAVYIYPKSENSHRVGETLEEKSYVMLEITDALDATLEKLLVTATIYNDQGEAKLMANSEQGFMENTQ